MSKVKELSTYLSENGNLATLNMLSYPVYLSEKLSSCNFYVQKGDGELLFFKGDGRKQINDIDRTLNKLYESAISHVLENESIYSQLPDNWKFSFDYFPSKKPAQIEYDHLPESKLVLSRIMVLNENGKRTKIIDDANILKEWSSKFNTDSANSIFTGTMNREKAASIVESLSISSDIAIENIFRQFGATPQLNESFESSVDSILIRVYQKRGKKPLLFKVSSEHIEAIKESQSYIPADSTAILVLDFLDYLNSRSLTAESVLSKNPDERYVEVMSSMFENYLKKKSAGIEGMNFENGEFATEDLFELNTEMVRNPDLYSKLKESEKAKKAFQIILNSFRMEKNESNNPLFSTALINTFNETVNRIKKITEAIPKDFMTFGDYLKLKDLNESIYSVETEAPREKITKEANVTILKPELLSEGADNDDKLFCDTIKESDGEYIKKQESE